MKERLKTIYKSRAAWALAGTVLGAINPALGKIINLAAMVVFGTGV